MTYIKTEYINDESIPINDNNLNKIEQGIKNNTIWQNAECDIDSDYSIEIDSWNTRENSYLQVYFNKAINANEIARLRINNENYINLIDTKNKLILGKEIEDKKVLLGFKNNSFETFILNSIPTFDHIYPIGSIYMSVNETNPSNLFGGTWVAWSKGMVPIGIDTTQTEFNVVEKIGGEKTHKLTISEIPSHGHSLNGNNIIRGGSGTAANISQNGGSFVYSSFDSNGGDQPHNNLQPYITCYMWKRTT